MNALMRHNPLTEGKPTLAENLAYVLERLLFWQGHIERAISKTGNMMTFDYVCEQVLTKQAHFYDLGDFCIIAQVHAYPAGNVYSSLIGCGNLERMKGYEDDFAEIARSLGCKYMRITGRPGWAKELQKDGWEHVSTSVQKEV